jgi:hypothetical protein
MVHSIVVLALYLQYSNCTYSHRTVPTRTELYLRSRTSLDNCGLVKLIVKCPFRGTKEVFGTASLRYVVVQGAVFSAFI